MKPLSTDYGQQDTWTREHLWPDTRGASGIAFYDIHNSRPETTRVTMIRGDMLYGECGTVEYADVCESPAFGAAPTDTSQDGKVWMPPASVRGDIARALFYMALRYGNEDPPLALSDCPPWQASMGILSQLLEWHEADPVSEEERGRNNNACQYWQGNRNPFVDYESLARRIFGEPQELPIGDRVYPSCLDIPTPSPTVEANDCNLLQPGDIFIYSVSGDDPDGIGFLALEDIPADVTLYITDYPWNGERFVRQEGEGIIKVGGLLCLFPCTICLVRSELLSRVTSRQDKTSYIALQLLPIASSCLSWPSLTLPCCLRMFLFAMTAPSPIFRIRGW
mgnify:CR=1 FL=1